MYEQRASINRDVYFPFIYHVYGMPSSRSARAGNADEQTEAIPVSAKQLQEFHRSYVTGYIQPLRLFRGERQMVERRPRHCTHNQVVDIRLRVCNNDQDTNLGRIFQTVNTETQYIYGSTLTACFTSVLPLYAIALSG